MSVPIGKNFRLSIGGQDVPPTPSPWFLPKPMSFELAEIPEATLQSFRDMQAEADRAHAEKLAAETERYCWKAIAKGVGWRVWRSDPVMDDRSFAITYRFALIPPDGAAPGKGVIFGPFSEP